MSGFLQPTAWAAAGLWAGGLALGRRGRWLHVAGVAVLLAHIAIAYAGFGWSHAAVEEHTRRTAGVGWGVWVNWLFAAVWLGDAVRQLRGRRPWWPAHAFLGFVVFNATVVYGGPAARVGGVAAFAGLAVVWWRR